MTTRAAAAACGSATACELPARPVGAATNVTTPANRTARPRSPKASRAPTTSNPAVKAAPNPVPPSHAVKICPITCPRSFDRAVAPNTAAGHTGDAPAPWMAHPRKIIHGAVAWLSASKDRKESALATSRANRLPNRSTNHPAGTLRARSASPYADSANPTVPSGSASWLRK